MGNQLKVEEDIGTVWQPQADDWKKAKRSWKPRVDEFLTGHLLAGVSI